MVSPFDKAQEPFTRDFTWLNCNQEHEFSRDRSPCTMRTPCLDGSVLHCGIRCPGAVSFSGQISRNLAAIRQTIHCSHSMIASVSKIQILKGISELPLHYKVCHMCCQHSPCTVGNDGKWQQNEEHRAVMVLCCNRQSSSTSLAFCMTAQTPIQTPLLQ